MEEKTDFKNQRKKQQKPAKPTVKPKGLPIANLAQKEYADIAGLDQEFKDCYGEIDEASDIIFFGDSSNGKTNAVADFIDKLIDAFHCKCNYISYEEGHGKTMKKTLIEDKRLFYKHGPCLTLYEDFTFEQLDYYMYQQRSAKIWVFDSIQASGLTYEQIKILKRKYVQGNKKKIFVFISWAEGKLPQGQVARSVRFYANIKVRVEGFIAFIRSRYGSKKNHVIWHEGAKGYWDKKFAKALKKK